MSQTLPTDGKKSTGFSRRHRTRAVHDATFDDWQDAYDEHFASALWRQAERLTRSASQQLMLLDERLGEGIGATRERARLLEVHAKVAA